ncbi:MAG: hypothetical protein K0R51_2957 [Cytophagaceae bacterium]|jgi:hypothetical protein|nr:hypothetical protein [Cytophagaceae bacterium]
MSHEEEKPPFLGSWNNVYALVIGSLVCMIVLFYLFTQYFA